MGRLEDAYSENLDHRELPSSRTVESHAITLFAIGAVAVILFLVSRTTPTFQEQLALHYNNPALYTFYTTHFVHNSTAHLQGNLTNYLVIVPLTYLICLRAGRHREFRLGFLAIFFVLPPLLSLVSYASLDLVIQTIFGFDPNVRSSRGFSALDGAFVGMLMVAVAVLFRDLADREAPLYPVIAMMVSYGAAVAFWGVFEHQIGPLTILLVLVPTIYTVWLVRQVVVLYDVKDWLEAGGWLRGQPVTMGLLLIGAFAAVWGTQGLLAFPWFEGGTNTLSHLTGLILGLVLSGKVFNCNSSSTQAE